MTIHVYHGGARRHAGPDRRDDADAAREGAELLAQLGAGHPLVIRVRRHIAAGGVVEWCRAIPSRVVVPRLVAGRRR